MKKLSALIFVFLLVFPSIVYSETYRDPFKSLLLEKQKETTGDQSVGLPSLDLTVQGVLWGGEFPQAIINQSVYREGDKLKEFLDAVVYKIEKQTVSILYGGRIYKIVVVSAQTAIEVAKTAKTDVEEPQKIEDLGKIETKSDAAELKKIVNNDEIKKEER